MNQFTTAIVEALIKKQDITEIFHSHLETVVNTLTAFLDYKQYDRIGFNSGNSHNGVYSRTLRIKYGDLEIKIPRRVQTTDEDSHRISVCLERTAGRHQRARSSLYLKRLKGDHGQHLILYIHKIIDGPININYINKKEFSN